MSSGRDNTGEWISAIVIIIFILLLLISTSCVPSNLVTKATVIEAKPLFKNGERNITQIYQIKIKETGEILYIEAPYKAYSKEQIIWISKPKTKYEKDTNISRTSIE
jgi:hypothetical protein